ncbi:MAG TPA: DedA family protein [Rhizobiales bacterium]|nr:DedA family protein [Hyphomicrobiales bacterium]
MTDTLFLLVSQYGVPIILIATFASCLAVPIPTGFMMLASGAFVASGDLVLWQAVAAAWGGAIVGDQVGFQVGRRGGAPLIARIERQPARAKALGKARKLIARWGGPGVFFTRWLFSPLGPYVNLLGGASNLPRPMFTFWGVTGEAVWVTVYIGLGYSFSDHIDMISELIGDAVGFLAAGAVTLGLGYILMQKFKKDRLGHDQV